LCLLDNFQVGRGTFLFLRSSYSSQKGRRMPGSYGNVYLHHGLVVFFLSRTGNQVINSTLGERKRRERRGGGRRARRQLASANTCRKPSITPYFDLRDLLCFHGAIVDLRLLLPCFSVSYMSRLRRCSLMQQHSSGQI
jgi:hypothetical protein